jgi:S-adenosyl-L-methionine hydrolase (adenosine-forming)
MTSYGWVSFTTDFGEADGFAAACRGVIARIAPTVRIIDVTHLVPPRDVRRGAGVLAQTAPWLPPAVHLAVVDPGVGSGRRGVCLAAGPSLLVGPDNGLLMAAADALGGLAAAYALEDPAYWLPSVSATFHGRDIFAPAAAHLCSGVSPDSLGSPVPVESLVRLPGPHIAVGLGRIETEVLSVDAFGNVQLAARSGDLHDSGLADGAAVAIHLGIGQLGPGSEVRPALLARTFSDVGPGELIVYVDSADYVAIAVNGGSAAATLGVGEGDVVLIAQAG